MFNFTVPGTLGMLLYTFCMDIQQFTWNPTTAAPSKPFPNVDDHSWQQPMIAAFDAAFVPTIDPASTSNSGWIKHDIKIAKKVYDLLELVLEFV